MEKLKLNIEKNYGRPAIFLLIDKETKQFLYRVEPLGPEYFVPGTDEVTSQSYSEYSIDRYWNGNLGRKNYEAERDPTIKLHPQEIVSKYLAEYEGNKPGEFMPQEFIEFIDETDVIKARAKSRKLRRMYGKQLERVGYTSLLKEVA